MRSARSSAARPRRAGGDGIRRRRWQSHRLGARLSPTHQLVDLEQGPARSAGRETAQRHAVNLEPPRPEISPFRFEQPEGNARQGRTDDRPDGRVCMRDVVSSEANMPRLSNRLGRSANARPSIAGRGSSPTVVRLVSAWSSQPHRPHLRADPERIADHRDVHTLGSRPTSVDERPLGSSRAPGWTQRQGRPLRRVLAGDHRRRRCGQLPTRIDAVGHLTASDVAQGRCCHGGEIRRCRRTGHVA